MTSTRSIFGRHGVLCVLSTAIFSACGPNEAILRSNSNQSQTQPAVSAPVKNDSVESEVENMRTADFEIILVLRRKDGSVVQPDDKASVRGLIPNANRRSLVDGEKAIVVGSNYPLTADSLSHLQERFTVENFSKPGAALTNANAGANGNMNR